MLFMTGLRLFQALMIAQCFGKRERKNKHAATLTG